MRKYFAGTLFEAYRTETHSPTDAVVSLSRTLSVEKST